MYTANFRYSRPKTLAEAEALFHAGVDAKYLAGGQTLIPTMKARLAAPSDLIDLSRLPGLSFMREESNALIIGAGTCHADVAASPVVKKAIPALADLAGGIGDTAVRHRGTLGGSVANNDPAADYPAALIALGATVKTTRRVILAEDFFTGMFATALEPSEIVTEVSFPTPSRAAYVKFRNPASRYAMVGVFVAKRTDGVRVAITGAGHSVFRVPEMEAALAKNFTPAAIAGIAISSDGLNGDLFGSAEYRAHLVTVMAKRAVAAALV
ncbi:MAG: xanthine dehydrogenase family protein subunit M [Alphaproteobacteria bacterium]|nr:xanthine dehydrogenase family protein subunit M [Alphaproteobacteria bacterium]